MPKDVFVPSKNSVSLHAICWGGLLFDVRSLDGGLGRGESGKKRSMVEMRRAVLELGCEVGMLPAHLI